MQGLMDPTRPVDGPPGDGGASRRYRALVVEDDPDQRAAFVKALVMGGFAVSHAGAGSDALRSALAQRPDVVVLDLMLPDAHGEEVAGAIRAMAGSTRMPIVVVTSYTDAAEQLDPKRFGAECVLTKPVDDEQLVRAVHHCLESPPVDTSASS